MKLGIPQVARVFLAIVGILYLGLALWCSLDPATTSTKVGFALQGDAGGSEFLTVYGGLEFGLGLMLLVPLIRSGWTAPILATCLVLHACLVLFRSSGFVFYPDPGSMTIKLAIGEWVILTLSALLYWCLSTSPSES